MYAPIKQPGDNTHKKVNQTPSNATQLMPLEDNREPTISQSALNNDLNNPNTRTLIQLQSMANQRSTINVAQQKPIIQRKKKAKLTVPIQYIKKTGKIKKRYLPDMDPLIKDIVDNYGDIDIPDDKEYEEISAKCTFLLSEILSLNGGAINSEFRLLNYLWSGNGSSPGLGSLAKINLKGKKITERPGFSSKTLNDISIKPSQARRHITAWHNIRSYLNILLAHDHKTFLDKTGTILKGLTNKEEYNEVTKLTNKMPAAKLGDFSQPASEGIQIISTAFMMNSQPNNLWPGDSNENSEIATFSAHFQAEAAKSKDYKKLANWVTSYNVKSPLGMKVQTALVNEIQTQQQTGVAPYIEQIKPLEVDTPPGTMTKKEKAIHERVFQVVFLNKPVNWKIDTKVLKWFINR